MADEYSCSIFIRVHLKECKALAEEQKQIMDTNLLRRWARIYSPIHALAFKCNPFYAGMHLSIVDNYGQYFFKLGKGDFTVQCHGALKLMANNGNHFNSLMNDFLSFNAIYQPAINSLKSYRLFFIWAKMKTLFVTLSLVMMDIYRSPSATAGVERKHKIGNNVLSQRRCRLSDLSHQRQS